MAPAQLESIVAQAAKRRRILAHGWSEAEPWVRNAVRKSPGRGAGKQTDAYAAALGIAR